MSDDHEDHAAANTAILTGILEGSPTEGVKKLLSVYSVEVKALTKIIKEMMTATPDTVGEAAVYLQIAEIDITTKASTKLLCKEIVKNLDNAMYEKCAVCEEWHTGSLLYTRQTNCRYIIYVIRQHLRLN